jgi:hypothetical protein
MNSGALLIGSVTALIQAWHARDTVSAVSEGLCPLILNPCPTKGHLELPGF